MNDWVEEEELAGKRQVWIDIITPQEKIPLSVQSFKKFLSGVMAASREVVRRAWSRHAHVVKRVSGIEAEAVAGYSYVVECISTVT